VVRSRRCYQLKFPKHWDVVKCQLDDALRCVYEDTTETNIKIMSFVKSKRHMLQAFSSEELIDAVLEAKGKFNTIPRVVAQLMEESNTCSAMFDGVWLDCSQTIFADMCKQQMKELEDGDFSEEHSTIFNKVCLDMSDRLRFDGHKRGKNAWPILVDIYGEQVPISLTYAGDRYIYLYWARVLTIALNNRQQTPFPWLDTLFPKGSIPYTPTEIVIPESLLDPLEILRSNAFEFVNDAGTKLSSQVKACRKEVQTLLDYHIAWELDFAFLEHKADTVLRTRVSRGCFIGMRCGVVSPKKGQQQL
jgi:hypothetical protein